MKTLSIIILSYNTADLLKNCLMSLIEKTKDLDYEIIVVDNASSDTSPQMIKTKFPQVKLVLSKINLGFAKGNNLGAKHACGRYLLFLNSDTTIENNALKLMVDYLNANSKSAVVGPKLLNKDGSIQGSVGDFPNLNTVGKMLFFDRLFKGVLSRKTYNKITQVDWVMGAALMIKREVYELIKGFDENIFMYYDEVELCYRLKLKEYRVDYYPEALITHLWQGSSQSGREGPILENFKNLIYFYKKHKNIYELFILRILLRTKAVISCLVGYLFNNRYLKETYAKAIKLV